MSSNKCAIDENRGLLITKILLYLYFTPQIQPTAY